MQFDIIRSTRGTQLEITCICVTREIYLCCDGFENSSKYAQPHRFSYTEIRRKIIYAVLPMSLILTRS